eukprot:gene13185-14533_t
MQLLNPYDARAIDIKYHRSCCITHVIRGKRQAQDKEFDEDESVTTIAADIEFFAMLINILNEGKIIGTDEVCTSYNEYRESYGIEESVSKKVLKDMFLKNIPGVHFSRPKKNKAEKVSSTVTKSKAIEAAEKKTNDDRMKETNDSGSNPVAKLTTAAEIESIFHCAKIIRQDILKKGSTDPWKFQGNLSAEENNRKIPASLLSLIRWISEGTSTGLKHEAWSSQSRKVCASIAESIIYNTNSDRQGQYASSKSIQGKLYHTKGNDTTMMSGTGFKAHTYTRSFIKTIPVFFAVDNIDFNEDTPEGRNTFHGTVLVAFEDKDKVGSSALPQLSFEPEETDGQNAKGISRAISEMLPCTVKGNSRPRNSPSYPDYDLNSSLNELSDPLQEDLSWLVTRDLSRVTSHDNLTSSANALVGGQRNQKIHTWAGFNSLAAESDDRPLTKVAALPLIAAPANE